MRYGGEEGGQEKRLYDVRKEVVWGKEEKKEGEKEGSMR